MGRFCDQPARFAFVIWPDFIADEPLSCIYLDGVATAVSRGAILVGREDEVKASAGCTFNPPRLYMGGDDGEDGS